MQQHAAYPPRLLHGGSLSQLSKEKLGEEFKLEPEQTIGWASSQERKKKQAGERALARLGKPDYDDWTKGKLERELRKRGIEWGQKRDPGKRRLLEEDDDQQPKKRQRGGGGTAAGRTKKPKKPKGNGKAKGKRKRGRQGQAVGISKSQRQRR